MEEYFLYIIFSKQSKRTYVGHTGNLKKRLHEHNSGKVKSTKPYRPYELLYKEKCGSKPEAIAREKYYKTYLGRKKIKEIILKAEMAELVDALDSKSSEAQTS